MFERPECPDGQTEKHDANESTAAGPIGRADEGEREPQGHDRERECHRVRVEVGVEVGEGRKLRDRPGLGVGMPDHAGWIPVPPVQGNRSRDPIGEDSQLAEIPDDCDEQSREHAREQHAPSGHGLPRALAAADERHRDAARPGAEESEKGRNREVVGDGGHDRGELHQHRDEHEPEVVVVHRATREPRVVGRKLGRLDDRVQEREIHRLLAAERRVPQVGVRPAHEGGSAEQHPEDGFLDEEEPAGLDQPGAELPAVRHRDTQRAGSNDADRDPDGRLRERRDPRAREQPHDPGDEKQSDWTGQRVSPVGKPRGRQPDVRQGDDSEEDEGGRPEDDGGTIREAPGIEELAPRSAADLGSRLGSIEGCRRGDDAGVWVGHRRGGTSRSNERHQHPDQREEPRRSR